MASQKDLQRSHRFGMRRGAGALLRTDADAAEGSLRRIGSGTVGSLAVGTVVALVFAVIGALSPKTAASAWQNGKTLIVSKQTGARFVYVDGALHPVLNYASALLILRSGAVTATSVPAAELAGVPRGAALGIPGAPDELPASGALIAGPWRVCSDPAVTAAGQDAPLVRLSVGPVGPVGPSGSADAGAASLPEDAGVLVSADGGTYLVWAGTRLLLPPYAVAALGYSSMAPIAVGDAWLDAVPAGPDLAAPAIPGAGGTGRGGIVAGRVYQAGPNGGTQSYYAGYPDGLAPITDVQARLLLADPGTAAAYGGSAVQAQSVTLAQAAAAPASAATPAATAGIPRAVPRLANADFPAGPGVAGGRAPAVCATLADASQGTVSVSVTAGTVALASGVPQPVDSSGTPIADTLEVAAGHGALVRAVPQPGVTTGTLYLLTDGGVKYPLPDTKTLTDLGLGAAQPQSVPEAFLRLVPSGPALEESAAVVSQPGHGSGS